jgi:hypothetical protein
MCGAAEKDAGKVNDNTQVAATHSSEQKKEGKDTKCVQLDGRQLSSWKGLGTCVKHHIGLYLLPPSFLLPHRRDSVRV